MGCFHRVPPRRDGPRIQTRTPPVQAIRPHAMDALGHPILSPHVDLASRFQMCRSRYW